MNGINRVRLNTRHDYYNTGVMLINLERARPLSDLDEVFRCVREHETELLLPDQDVFNYIYGTRRFPWMTQCGTTTPVIMPNISCAVLVSTI